MGLIDAGQGPGGSCGQVFRPDGGLAGPSLHLVLRLKKQDSWRPKYLETFETRWTMRGMSTGGPSRVPDRTLSLTQPR